MSLASSGINRHGFRINFFLFFAAPGSTIHPVLKKLLLNEQEFLILS